MTPLLAKPWAPASSWGRQLRRTQLSVPMKILRPVVRLAKDKIDSENPHPDNVRGY